MTALEFVLSSVRNSLQVHLRQDVGGRLFTVFPHESPAVQYVGATMVDEEEWLRWSPTKRVKYLFRQAGG